MIFKLLKNKVKKKILADEGEKTLHAEE